MPMLGTSASMRKNVQDTRIFTPAVTVIAVCSADVEAPSRRFARPAEIGEAQAASIPPSANSLARIVKKQATIAKIVASM